jgi:hypothetical protein
MVAAVLYLAINKHEPNRRLAFALETFIVVAAVAANRPSLDAIAAGLLMKKCEPSPRKRARSLRLAQGGTNKSF